MICMPWRGTLKKTKTLAGSSSSNNYNKAWRKQQPTNPEVFFCELQRILLQQRVCFSHMTGLPLNNKFRNPDIIAAKDPDITAEERRKDNQANSFINRFAATLILLFVSFINNNVNTRQHKTQKRERGFQRSEGRESREKELREPREASGASRVCKCFVLMRRKEKGPNVDSILSLSHTQWLQLSMQLSPNLSLFSLSVQFASCSSLVKVSVDLTIRAVLDVPSESQTSIRPSHHCSEKVGPWQLFFLMRGVEACAPAFSLSLSLSLSLSQIDARHGNVRRAD